MQGSPVQVPFALRRGFFYGWVIVAIVFIGGLTSAGVRSAAAIFIVPLETEFGWNRAAIAAAVSINLLLFGVAAPISGRLIDRFGPRYVMMGAIAIWATGLALTPFMNDLWQLYLLWGVFVGMGTGAAGSVISATVSARWFVARRGLIVGVLGTATSTGQLIFIPILMAMVVNLGWRAGSLLMVGAGALVFTIIMFFMRNDPKEVGQEPYGAGTITAAQAAQEEQPPISIRDAIRAPEFWLLAGAFFTCGGSSNGLIGTHLIPHSLDHGIPEVTAATTVAVMGGLNVVGTVCSGWLTDRYDPRRLLALYYAGRGLSLFILPFVTDFTGLMIFAIAFGLDWFATVPPTVALTTRRFGRRSVGTIYGWTFLAHQVGAATMALGAGAMRVTFGDYSLAFVAGGILAMIGAALAYQVRVEQARATPTPTAAAA
jgi:sugar phosphate permease